MADVAEILARLPILAERLPELPQAQLRAILEGLQLSITYLPDTHEADIEIVLRDDGTAWPDVSQVWAVLLTGHYSNLRDESQKLAIDLETLARDEFRTS